jgi:hypothetical protein
MAIPQEPSDGVGLLGSLLALPPWARLFMGLLLGLLGAGLAVALWGRGFISGVTIFLVVIGFFLSWSGISGIQRQARQQTLLKTILERKEEMLKDMIDLKLSGKNPVRYLNDQGVQDGDLRSALMEEMKQRIAERK